MAHNDGSINIFKLIRDRERGLVPAFKTSLFGQRLALIYGDTSKNLYKNDIVQHFGCVNALEFGKDGQFLITGGDDRRVLMFRMDQVLINPKNAKATICKKQHDSNIFALSFDNFNTKIFSGGNDDTCIVHDIQSGEVIDVFLHSKPVYGLSVCPINENGNVFATAGEDGRILIFDLRTSASETMSLAKYRTPFHAVQFHPSRANLLATANAKEGAALFDMRTPRTPALRYGREAESCMSVRFNTEGSQVLALRRRLPPVLYATDESEPVAQFYHESYYNSCTMKSCCFAGEKDEHVLSGSDDFGLYIWKVPDSTKNNQWVEGAKVLTGHRSIVNQVRYNHQKCLIASSGVEKVVKLWTPFALHDWTLLNDTHTENARKLFTYEEYLSMVHTGQMSHDYNTQNTSEDPRMMAFFDHLVQREIEEWNDALSKSSDCSSDDSKNSSRRDSSSASADPMVKRRTDKTSVQQRTRYRNRIAYLIATKRKKLKRLALRSTPKYKRPISRKFREAKTRHRKPAPVGKRRKNVKRAKREYTSDSEAPRPATKKRRLQSYNAPTYKSFRKKIKTPQSSTSNTSTRAADKSDSSSSSEDESNKINLNKFETERRQILLDVPSTSSGITSNGKGVLFRIQNFHDSDSELSDIPINPAGAENSLPSMQKIHSPVGLRGSFDEEEDDLNFTNSSMNEYLCSSPSNNSRFSSSFHDGDEDTLTSGDDDNDNNVDNDSNTKTAEATPKKENNENNQADSGMASASASMVKEGSSNNNNNNVTGIDSKLLLDKLNRVKSNYRNNCEDSDSD